MLASSLSPCLQSRLKLLILTDIGGDPDDQQSMIRLMVHSNHFQIVGLIATSRMRHGQDTQPGLIWEIVQAYGKAHANLSIHCQHYPPMDSLLQCIKSGSAHGGIEHIQALSEGASHIIDVVDKTTEDQPIHLCIWGGATDLAQALNRVQSTRSTSEVTRFVSRLFIHAIDDQDGTGAWINGTFPEPSIYPQQRCARRENQRSLSRNVSKR